MHDPRIFQVSSYFQENDLVTCMTGDGNSVVLFFRDGVRHGIWGEGDVSQFPVYLLDEISLETSLMSPYHQLNLLHGLVEPCFGFDECDASSSIVDSELIEREDGESFFQMALQPVFLPNGIVFRPFNEMIISEEGVLWNWKYIVNDEGLVIPTCEFFCFDFDSEYHLPRKIDAAILSLRDDSDEVYAEMEILVSVSCITTLGVEIKLSDVAENLSKGMEEL